MTDTLKPCPIDEGHLLIEFGQFVACNTCGINSTRDAWQSLPRNEKPKGPRTKEELSQLYFHCDGNLHNERIAIVVTAAREDIAAMVREKIDRSGRTARDNGLLSQLADEIERMP